MGHLPNPLELLGHLGVQGVPGGVQGTQHGDGALGIWGALEHPVPHPTGWNGSVPSRRSTTRSGCQVVRGRMGPGQVRAGGGVPSPSSPLLSPERWPQPVTNSYPQHPHPLLCKDRCSPAERTAVEPSPKHPHAVHWGGCPHGGPAQPPLPFHSAQQPCGPCPAEGAVVAAMVRPRRRYCPAWGAGGTRCHRGERR